MSISEESLEKFTPYCSCCGERFNLSDDVYVLNGEMMCKSCFEEQYTIKSAYELAEQQRDSVYESSVSWEA